MEKVVEVVAALILRDGENGKEFMICQRPSHKARGMLWEFVGGKVEPGETLRQALIRECLEELAVTVEPGEVFAEVDHVYPDIHIRLTLFRARIVSGEPRLLEHNDLCWITPDRIPEFAFCPADTDILTKIEEIKDEF